VEDEACPEDCAEAVERRFEKFCAALRDVEKSALGYVLPTRDCACGESMQIVLRERMRDKRVAVESAVNACCL